MHGEEERKPNKKLIATLSRKEKKEMATLSPKCIKEKKFLTYSIIILYICKPEIGCSIKLGSGTCFLPPYFPGVKALTPYSSIQRRKDMDVNALTNDGANIGRHKVGHKK